MSDAKRRGPGERAGLSEEQVLSAARTLSARDGAELLTMRRLAADLGVAPNTLYSYYQSKDALLDAVLDSLLADISTEDLDAEHRANRSSNSWSIPAEFFSNMRTSSHSFSLDQCEAPTPVDSPRPPSTCSLDWA